MECSRGLKNIVLREYQMQALFWMLQRERGVVDERLKTEQAAASGDSNLWERHPFTDGTCFFFCPMFRMATLENPNELYRMCGGIIADEMGLGKTITMLSLLLVNRSKEDEVVSVLKENSVSSDGVENSNMVKDSNMVENGDTAENNNTKRNTTHPRLTEEGSELTPSLIVPKKNKGGTLIICPLSLLYTVHLSSLPHPQWQAEIITHVEADALACCVYHNGSFYEIAIDHKPKRLPSMLGCGVVLTTYDSCVAAYANDGRRENWLYETQWKRIVIDEGHIIKNEKWGLGQVPIVERGCTRRSCPCAGQSTGSSAVRRCRTRSTTSSRSSASCTTSPGAT